MIQCILNKSCLIPIRWQTSTSSLTDKAIFKIPDCELAHTSDKKVKGRSNENRKARAPVVSLFTQEFDWCVPALVHFFFFALAPVWLGIPQISLEGKREDQNSSFKRSWKPCMEKTGWPLTLKGTDTHLTCFFPLIKHHSTYSLSSSVCLGMWMNLL